MASKKKTKRAGLRVTKDEQAMVEELAKDAGLSVADYLRQLIRDTHKKTVKGE